MRVMVWAKGVPHERIVEGGKREALEAEARLRIELKASSRTPRRTAPPFSVFCLEQYTPHAQAHLGASSWSMRRYHLATLISFFGRTCVTDITTDLVNEYTAMRAKQVQPSSVNNELRCLSVILRFARSDCEYPMRDVKIHKLREPVKRVRPWGPAEVRRLLATCARLDRPMLPLVTFLLETGCRKGEALAALWSWVRRGTLHIEPSEGWTPKSKRPREVPVSDALARVLDRLPRRGPWIFPNREGDRYVKFPDMRFLTIVKKAGLSGSPHKCRHTFASTYLAKGGSLFELSALLGHSAARTTEIYAHLMPDHLERARNVLNSKPRGILGSAMARSRATA